MTKQVQMEVALQARWESLMKEIDAPDAEADDIWEDLVAHYSAPDRHYHTLRHLYMMLNVVDELSYLARDLTTIRLAIFFHDVIYDVTQDDNEARSADYATDALVRLGVGEDVIERVEDLIMATSKHFNGDGTYDKDTQILLDADLVTLGAAASESHAFADAIRKEFITVPDETYLPKRIEMMQSLLARERVFYTRPMREAYEAQARANVSRELDRLQEACNQLPC